MIHSTKPIEVFPGSSKLVEGILPPASLLLIGQPGVGKTVFCKQFLYNGFAAGEPCIYLSTDESPMGIADSMKRFGFNLEGKKSDIFRIVDCYSWKLGDGSLSEYMVSNPADLAFVLGTTQKAMRGLSNLRLVFDSITGLTSICSHSNVEVSKFLQIMVAEIRNAGGKAVFTVTPEAHDLQFMSLLRQTFDGTLEMKEDETVKEIKRLLRVFSLRDAKHKTTWMPFEITDHGIVVKSDVELRCAMCSRLIDWEPQSEVIRGKEFNFDSIECANTYKKLKKLYGDDFA
ncbi:MAG: ATPase domain-containing protein [Candidatus Bathyarchaeia archaeon]|jgi:KaiC/GvpD/RAD55 family RecA-like ATPase